MLPSPCSSQGALLGLTSMLAHHAMDQGAFWKGLVASPHDSDLMPDDPGRREMAWGDAISLPVVSPLKPPMNRRLDRAVEYRGSYLPRRRLGQCEHHPGCDLDEADQGEASLC